MLKWIFAGMGLLFVGVVVVLVTFQGQMAQPMRLIGATKVRSWESAGALVERRLHQDIKEWPAVVLASSPELPRSAEVWNGFLKTLYAQGLHQAVVWEQEGLTPLIQIQGFTYRTYPGPQALPLSAIKKSVKMGKKVILTALSTEALKMTHGSLASVLQKQTSFYYGVLAQQPFRYQMGAPECSGPCPLKEATSRFVRSNQKHLRNAAQNDLYIGLQRWSLHDYLFFLPAP